MKSRLLSRFLNNLTSARGIATSLMEATATISVGAVLAGVAVGSAIDAINDSKVQGSIADLQAIGQGVSTFYQDTFLFPGYRMGDDNGPTSPIFEMLVSENGTYPKQNPDTNWTIDAAPTPWVDNIHFGEQALPQHDTIENHLVENTINEELGNRYTGKGNFVGDPGRGWSGPYVSQLPKTDPWGSKYIINIRDAHVRHLSDAGFTQLHRTFQFEGAIVKTAVFVISAGANRTLETNSEQSADGFRPLGDDIIFRIK